MTKFRLRLGIRYIPTGRSKPIKHSNQSIFQILRRSHPHCPTPTEGNPPRDTPPPPQAFSNLPMPDPGLTRELTRPRLPLPGQSLHLSAAGFSGGSLLGSDQLHPNSFQPLRQTLVPHWAPPSWSAAESLPRAFEGSGTSVLRG